jgi:phage terminase large subunit-like protein
MGVGVKRRVERFYVKSTAGIKMKTLVDFMGTYEREMLWRIEGNEAKRLFCQEFLKRNFEAFVWLLGYRDVGEFHKSEMREIGKAREVGGEVRRLWIWSRGFFKTSLITEAHTVWLIVNNPDIRVLIVSYTIEVAKKPFGAIRNHFMVNEGFRYFFKEFCPSANADGKIEFGTTEELTIPNRRRRELKEPTLKCVGVGTNITGLHFDYIKIDDLVTKDSVTNDTQIESSKDYYSKLRYIFDNPTIPREDVIGTIYHFNDFNCCLQKNKEFRQSFVPVHDGAGKFYFPERIGKEGFERICKDPAMNPYDIQSQYLLNPIDPAARKFKDEWVQYYDTLPEGLSEYLLGDPASTVKKKSDYTVIMRWGVDKDMNVYLLDGIRDKLLASDRVSLYVSMARQAKRLKGAKYEVIGGRHGDLENIRAEFIKNMFHVEPKETKSTNASKHDRIEQRLTGQFNAGKIFFPRKMSKVYRWNGLTYDFVEEYLLEYRQFPFSEHDDILDCHSQLFDGEYIQKGNDKVVEKKVENEFDFFRQLSIEAKTSRRAGKYVFGRKEKHWAIDAQKSFR